MALNPIHILKDYLYGNTMNIIANAEAVTQTKFEDWCVSVAKDNEDLYKVRQQAAKAFKWWNNI